jgi:uncharacterized protein YdhG (YjbR/CyaY superfamily)
MDESQAEYTNIDEYIAQFPPDVREKLREMRRLIKEAAPEAVETIGYQIPTFKQNGNLVHFAAFKNHIGFYPAPSGIEAFDEELAPYKAGKGTIQFPLDQPIPAAIVQKVVRYRVAENEAKAARKRKS